MGYKRALWQMVDRAQEVGFLDEADRIWAYNTLLSQVTGAAREWCDLQDEDVRSNLMGLLMPRPSQVATRFWQLHAENPQMATDYLYRLSCDADYVRTAAIARNQSWDAETRWGTLRITVNLSKPEKDPRDIAKLAAAAPSVSSAAGAAAGPSPYPACRLCMENEGYRGRTASELGGAYPARGNLRIVPIQLGGQRWGLQYSPYAYYNEHCIAMNSAHVPMHVDRPCFEAMFDFVDLFPHYFIGSNADLPIVGGSILNHDHFQGGSYRFPMDEAPDAEPFSVDGFPTVRASVLKWPVSVLTLRGEDRADLVDCACHILDAWRVFDDEDAGIVSHSDDMPHNTITPILRREGEGYKLSLALRCNVTSPRHPLGEFHPHEELHHIKKENIGLIEVMGLAILPARLKRELAAVEGALLSCSDLRADNLTAPHADWAESIERRYRRLDAGTVGSVLRREVGATFGQVLETAGVFKWDEPGRAALHRFLDRL